MFEIANQNRVLRQLKDFTLFAKSTFRPVEFAQIRHYQAKNYFSLPQLDQAEGQLHGKRRPVLSQEFLLRSDVVFDCRLKQPLKTISAILTQRGGEGGP